MPEESCQSRFPLFLLRSIVSLFIYDGHTPFLIPVDLAQYGPVRDLIVFG